EEVKGQCTGVINTWDLVLAAELAKPPHPALERAGASQHHRGWREADPPGTVRLVVGIAFCQRSVELVAEVHEIGGLVEELDDILVIAGDPFEDGTDVPFSHGRTGNGGGPRDRSLQLLADQMLAERREGLAGPAREGQERRIPRF